MKAIIFSAISLLVGFLSSAKNQEIALKQKHFQPVVAQQTSFSIEDAVTDYLKIKNALVKSDSKAAAETAKAMEATLSHLRTESLSASQKTTWGNLVQDATKQAKIVAMNSGKLDKQRQAFQQLSKSIIEMVTTFGTSQKLYQDYCPMFQGGAPWLSETKDIKNPYYGASMLKCGTIKSVIE